MRPITPIPPYSGYEPYRERPKPIEEICREVVKKMEEAEAKHIAYRYLASMTPAEIEALQLNPDAFQTILNKLLTK